jgi:hypothetical protein
MFVFSTTIPAELAIHNETKHDETFHHTPLNGYFLFGFMTLIDPDTSISEFEVVSFVYLRGNGDTTRLNQGEMIKIYAPIFGVIFNDLFIGYVGDYSIIG